MLIDVVPIKKSVTRYLNQQKHSGRNIFLWKVKKQLLNQTYTHTDIQIETHTSTHTQIHTETHTHTHTPNETHTDPQTHRPRDTHTHTHIHPLTHTQTLTHTHTHRHTHTHLHIHYRKITKPKLKEQRRKYETEIAERGRHTHRAGEIF